MSEKIVSRRGFKFPPYIFLLLPAVSFMLIMYGYPFITSIARSFIGKQGNLTLENYIKTWDLYLKDILFTFGVTLFSTVFTAVFAILIAVYLQIGRAHV